jgi:hypothetical protein
MGRNHADYFNGNNLKWLGREKVIEHATRIKSLVGSKYRWWYNVGFNLVFMVNFLILNSLIMKEILYNLVALFSS